MVTVEGLQIEIKDNSQLAASGLNKLTNALQGLKSAVGSGLGLDKVNKQLKELVKNASSLNNMNLDKVSNSFRKVQDAAGSLGKELDMIKSRDININTNTAVSSIRDVGISSIESTQALTSMSTTATGLSNSFVGMDTIIEAARIAIEQIITGTSRLGSVVSGAVNPGLQSMYSIIGKISSIIPAVTGATTASQGLSTSLSMMDRVASAKNITSSVVLMSSEIGKADSKANSFNDSISSIDDHLNDAANAAANTKQEIQKIVPTVEDVGSSAKESAIGMATISGAAQKSAPAMKTFAASMNSVAKSGRGIPAFLRGIALDLKSKLIPEMKSTDSTLKKVLTSMKRILYYRILRKIFSEIAQGAREGFQNLAQYSEEANAAMSSLVTGSLYMKNSFAAMLAPLLNAVLPALQMLISLAVSAANAINQLLSALSGRSVFTKAKEYAVDYADSLGSAAGAAEELKGLLAGFDELNIIQQQPGGGGGGGAGGGGYADMFEEAEIAQNITDFVARMKELIAAERWEELGALFAEKLNVLIDSADTWLEFTLRPWAVKWSRNVARILNGFVDALDWRSIGDLFATGINVILDTINTFMETFDFVNLGSGLADAVNGWFDEIDWELLGRTFGNKWNSLFDTIYGFVTGTNWTTVGKSIAKSVNSWFTTIKWSNIGRTITLGIRGLLRSLISFIKELDWKQIGTEIGKLIREIDWQGIVDDINELVAGLINGVSLFIAGLFELPEGSLSWIEDLVGMAGNLIIAFGLVVPAISKVVSAIQGLKKETIGIGLLVAGISFAFSGASDIGSGDASLVDYLKTALGAALGIAGSLLLFGTGPLGWTIGIGLALTAIVSGFVVGNKEAVSKMIEDAFYGYSEGSVTITMLAENFQLAMDTITATNKPIIDSAVSMSIAGNSAKKAGEEITVIAAAINMGAYTAEEKIPQLKTLFEQLATDTETALDSTYDTIVRAVSTSLYDSLTAAGVYVPEIISTLAGIKGDVDTTFDSLITRYDELSLALEEGRVSPENYATEILSLTESMQSLIGKVEPAKEAFIGVSEAIEGINWESPSAVDNAFEMIRTSAENATISVNDAYQGVKTAVEEMRGWSSDPQFQLSLDQILLGNESTRASQLTTIDTELQNMFGIMQRSIMEKLSIITQDAGAKWDSMGFWERLFTPEGSKEQYIANRVTAFKTDIADPIVAQMIYTNNSVGTRIAEQTDSIFLAVDEALYAYPDDLSNFNQKEHTDTVIQNAQNIIDQATIGLPEYVRNSVSPIGPEFTNGIIDSMDSNKASLTSVADKAKSIIANIKGFFMPEAKSAGKDIGAEVPTNIKDNIPTSSTDITTATETMVTNSVSAAAPSLVDPSKELTKAVVDGSVQGFNDYGSLYTDAITKMAEDGQDAYKTANDINSPSGVYKGFASDDIDGYVLGIETNKNRAITSIRTMLFEINAAFSTFSFASGLNVMFNQMLAIQATFIATFTARINQMLQTWRNAMSVINSSSPSTSMSAGGPTFGNTYASGGFPSSGEYFLARENGIPEMVGQIGNRTAVANNDQIVSGIATAVAGAEEEGNALLRQQNQILMSILEKTGSGAIPTGADAGRYFQTALNAYHRVAGTA